MGSTTPEAIAEQLQQSSEWNAIAEAVFVCPMEPQHIAGVCEVERGSFPVPWTERMFTDEWNNPLSRYVVWLDRQNPSTVIAYAGYWKRFDEEHHTDYYHTLKLYVKNHLNAVQTAKQLFIHRSTFLYRMEKMKEIANLDLDDFDTLLYVMMTFRMMELEGLDPVEKS